MDQIESILHSLDRLQSVNAIQNMISTTSYMFAIGEYSTIYSFFADREDISAEIVGWSRQTGHEAVRALLVDTWETYAAESSRRLAQTFPEDKSIEGRNGLLDLRALASPIIEVAGDGQTAKGLWLIPGTQTFVPEGAQLPRAHWVWTKLAVDMIRENGRWRIWHLLSAPVLSASYNQSWVEGNLAGEKNCPTLTNAYNARGTYPHPPAPPKPYNTFSETFSY